MTKTSISTNLAPVPVASYSQAVRRGNQLFLAGQGGFDAATDELVGPGVREQTRQALQNLKHVVEAAGGTMDDVVTVRVFISEHAEFAGMNEVYGEFFSDPLPARTTVSAGLGPGMKVEIDGVAILGD
ncbi:RidA family protein [Agromyces aerolatus]|uniref:RidA family protein n=1 Tax=Agromyces sp. LY-1074 TaxID=3074080 RepID=UPI002858A440|nr:MULTISPECIES: Rid family detoxifying hydrolase [unclassified Agromyces]MDR5699547.1 Rid family detoxifying hydrolase [Agromyces sp. LY-1074]MDR5705843.1 Rid family detoxifying hydrolase [Agromyces sp. LY-1358]